MTDEVERTPYDPIFITKKYDSSNVEHLDEFVVRIRALNDKQTRWFLAALQNASLMFFSPEIQADIDEMLARAEQPVDGEDLIVNMFKLMPGRHLADMQLQLVHWIREGEDTTEEKSIGGWNDAELMLAASILNYAETV